MGGEGEKNLKQTPHLSVEPDLGLDPTTSNDCPAHAPPVIIL